MSEASHLVSIKQALQQIKVSATYFIVNLNRAHVGQIDQIDHLGRNLPL